MAEHTPPAQIYDRSVRIKVVNFVANGEQTLFSVGEAIGVLFYVALNGDIQRKDVNYFHIAGTSNIIFGIAPPVNTDVIIAYYPKKEYDGATLINKYGQIINITAEHFVYSGATLVFTTQYLIDSIIYLEINGLVDIEGLGYSITGPNEVTLLTEPLLDSVIGITYFY
jgi:hypothetical protein